MAIHLVRRDGNPRNLSSRRVTLKAAIGVSCQDSAFGEDRTHNGRIQTERPDEL